MAGSPRSERERFDALAPYYNSALGLVEKALVRRWRRAVWAEVGGAGRWLEVGIGTGYNLPFYPPETNVTGVDVSLGMLRETRSRCDTLGWCIPLVQGDVEHLPYPDAAFAGAVATLVFCSVPDPVVGLRELARVVRPGGRIVLLEHMRARHSALAHVMDAANGLAWRLIGEDINRDTPANVRAAGLEVLTDRSLWADGIVRLIVARHTTPPNVGLLATVNQT